MIPLSTTTVTITQPTPGDPYEAATGGTTLAAGVPAHISAPSGRERIVGGQGEVIDAVLLCETVAGLNHYCIVTDDALGDIYSVAWVRRRRGLGLDHTKAGLRATSGASNG